MARLVLAVCLLAVSLSAVAAAPQAPVQEPEPTPAPIDPSPVTTTATPAPIDPSPVPTTATPAAPTPIPTTPADLSCMLTACPANKAALVPSLCRCQAYFECSDKGEAQARLCKAWQNFHPTKKECVFWDQVDCTWPGSITTRAPPATTQAPPVPGCDFVPSCPSTGSSKQGIPCKDSCKSYIQCKDGKWTKEKCGWLQPSFDTKSGKCVMWGAVCAA